MSSDIKATHNSDPLLAIPRTTRDKLYDGIEEGDCDLIEAILKDYPNILHLQSKYHFCDFLHLAAMNNHTEVCQLLLEHGAIISKLDDSYDTPLHVAIRHETDIELVRMLIRKGADLKVANIYGNTPLLDGASIGSMEVLEEILIHESSNVCHKNVSGKTALHILVECWNEIDDQALKSCVDLLVSHGATVNAQDKRGNTVLHSSVWTENDIILKHLLSIGVDPFIQNDEGGNFLHIMENFFDANTIAGCVETMIDIFDQESKLHQNTDITINFKKLINCKNHFGKTAFHCILKADKLSFIDQLLQSYVDNSRRDNFEKTYLHYTVDEPDSAEKVKLLLKYNGSVNVKDIYGRTPLFKTQDNENDRLLLSNGANPNIRDKIGLTPLHHAAMFHSFEKVKILIEEGGADVNAVDINGSTPLHFARWWSFEEIANLLIAHGASEDIKDRLGFSPVDIDSLDKAAQRSRITELPLKFSDSENMEDIFTLSDDACLRLLLNKLIIQREGISKRFIDEITIPSSIEEFTKQALSSHKVGLVETMEETHAVKRIIVDLLTNVMDTVSTLDKRFSVELLQTGSIAEGTRVGEPDEYDFLCILKNFSDACVIDERGDYVCDGFVQLISKENIQCEFEEYFGKNGKLDAEKVRSKFYSLLKMALSNKDLWEDNPLYLMDFVDNSDKPVLTLDVNYMGSQYKVLEISIDIVPAIYKKSWWPKLAAGDDTKLLRNDIRERGCAVLLQHPEMNRLGGDDENYFRISCAPAEIELFKNMPDFLIKAYALAKICVGNIFCPQIIFEEENLLPGCAGNFISSYMLKNCLFYLIEENTEILHIFNKTYQDFKNCQSNKTGCRKEAEAIKTSGDSTGPGIEEIGEVARMTFEIFRKLANFSLKCNFPSYFLPDVNIFNFEYMLIYKQEGDELNATSRHNSLCRLAYISLIMYILGGFETD